jgi:hypothetical protein
MRKFMIALGFLLVASQASAAARPNPGIAHDVATAFDGQITSDATVYDDIKFCFGDTTCDWWWIYNTSSQQFEMWHTDCDGGGSDCAVMVCADGADDCALTGVWTASGGMTIDADDADFAMGAAGTSDFYMRFNGTDEEINCPGCSTGVQFNASPVTGPMEIFPDSGVVVFVNQEASSALSDGDEISLVMSLNSNNAFKAYSETDGSGGTDVLGVEYFGLNGGEAQCRYAQETLTFAGGAGDASKTTSGLIPDGATAIAVTARVLVAGTTCTSADYGDGSDVDLYGNNVAITAGTTLTSADYTAARTYNAIASEEVTITGVGGNCVDLSVRVQVRYCTHTAPTE